MHKHAIRQLEEKNYQIYRHSVLMHMQSYNSKIVCLQVLHH